MAAAATGKDTSTDDGDVHDGRALDEHAEWYNDLSGSLCLHALLPCNQYMYKLKDYLHQGYMDSNGNSSPRAASKSTIRPPIVWSVEGINGQHSASCCTRAQSSSRRTFSLPRHHTTRFVARFTTAS